VRLEGGVRVAVAVPFEARSSGNGMLYPSLVEPVETAAGNPIEDFGRLNPRGSGYAWPCSARERLDSASMMTASSSTAPVIM
jgi:hypothetical protein